jgi:hypothetical protein
MRHVEVKITRDTQTAVAKAVPEWEIPVLEFIYDSVNVERTGEYVTVNREYPSAEFEYDRLCKAYGKDNQSGVPHAASVFGNAGVGIRALKKIMLDERAAETAESSPAEVTKPARKRRAVASSGDPLLA